MQTIGVRDLRNPERLLGWLMIRPRVDLRHGARFRVSVHPPMCPPFCPTDAEHVMDRVVQVLEFQVDYRTTNGGWTLLTDTPLGVLQWHPYFRLPGETEQQAGYRRLFA